MCGSMLFRNASSLGSSERSSVVPGAGQNLRVTIPSPVVL